MIVAELSWMKRMDETMVEISDGKQLDCGAMCRVLRAVCCVL